MTRCLQRPSGTSLLCALALLTAAPAFAAGGTVLIGHGDRTAWKYLDDGTYPGDSWCEASFDDSRWKSGSGPLGYNEAGLGTRVGPGGEPASRPITTYFRHGFRVAPETRPAGMLLVLIRCDDGAVVRLNGKELARANMRPGSVSHDTTATLHIEGSSERKYGRFVVPCDSLTQGENLLAVEVHQASATSDDLFFDLLLKSYPEGEEPRPGKVSSGARDVTLTYRGKHYVGPELRIPDGYRDGGRGMSIGEGDAITTFREVLVVDRTRDAALRKHLDFARSDELKPLEPIERARRIARYIHDAMSGPEEPSRLVNEADVFLAEYENREVLIGDVEAGVCRHEALLFKIMADEAGLRTALVRGNYRGLGSSGGHAWNELMLEGDRKLLVDVTNPRPDFRFPETGSRIGRRYLSVSNEPLYGAKDAARGVDAKKAATLRELARLPWAHVEPKDDDAEKELRRAAEAGAADEAAWNRLVALLIRGGRFEDLESLGKRGLEREDSARARLALAKACEGLGRLDEAGRHVKEALQRQPDDLLANLAAAVLALREGDGAAARAAVGEPMRKAQAALTRVRSREGWLEFHVVVALHLSLSGKEDAALEVLELVLARDPRHEEARRLFDALE
jgi:hypothetical protein